MKLWQWLVTWGLTGLTNIWVIWQFARKHHGEQLIWGDVLLGMVLGPFFGPAVLISSHPSWFERPVFRAKATNVMGRGR